MATITKIESQKRQAGFNIFLDGKFAFGLNALVFLQANLRQNQTISPRQITELVLASDFQRYYDKAVNLISFRPRSEKEIAVFLSKKIPASPARKTVSSRIIAKLKQNGYLNDAEFIDWWLDQRQTFRPRSKRFLKAELLQKGIDADLIEQKLSGLNQQTQIEAARKLIEKKPRDRKKLTAYLYRYGFDWETIRQALAQIDKKR